MDELHKSNREPVWHQIYLRRAVPIFAMISVIALSAALWTTWQLVSRTTQDSVVGSTAAANLAMTEIFGSEVWHELKPLLPDRTDSAEQARSNRNLPAIDAIVRRFSRNTDIVKVKIFDVKGLTLYSSEPRQIGEDKQSAHRSNSTPLQALWQWLLECPQNDEPGVFRKSISSAVELRPRIALRCG